MPMTLNTAELNMWPWATEAV